MCIENPVLNASLKDFWCTNINTYLKAKNTQQNFLALNSIYLFFWKNLMLIYIYLAILQK